VLLTEFTSPYSLNTQCGWHTSKYKYWACASPNPLLLHLVIFWCILKLSLFTCRHTVWGKCGGSERRKMWYTLVHCDWNGRCTVDGFIKRSTLVVNSWHLPVCVPIKSLVHNQHWVYIIGCYSFTSGRCRGSGSQSPAAHCGDL